MKKRRARFCWQQGDLVISPSTKVLPLDKTGKQKKNDDKANKQKQG